MNALTDDSLVEKIDNVLETMCFVMADPIGAGDLEETPPMQAWIRYHNATECGCVQLSATLGFVQEAASGLLGVDSDDISSESEALETLLELANVIGGEVVSLLGGEEVFFEMGIPSREPIHVDGAVEHTSVAFDSMGETFCVHVDRAPVVGQADVA